MATVYTKQNISRLNTGDDGIPSTWNDVFDQIEANLDEFFNKLGNASEEDRHSDGGIIPETDKTNTWAQNQTFSSGFVSNGSVDFNAASTFDDIITANFPVTINSTLTVTGATEVQNSVEIDQDLTVHGNLTISGTSFTVDSQTISTDETHIVLNAGETGAGVTDGRAGIEIDRGTSDTYYFEFNESVDRFVIGTSGNRQAVATREDSPNSDGVAFWNATATRMDTATFTYDQVLIDEDLQGNGGNIPRTDRINNWTANQNVNGNDIFGSGGSLNLSGTTWLRTTTGTDSIELQNSSNNYILRANENRTVDFASSITANGNSTINGSLDVNGNINNGNNQFIITTNGTTSRFRSSGNRNSGLTLRPDSNPSVGESLFAVENSTGALEFEIEYNNRGYFSYNLYVEGDISGQDIEARSDERMKENIHELTDTLDKLSQIKGYNYNFIGNEQEKIGVIAQEVQKVYPELVKERDDVYHVSYNGLVAALVEAVNELNSKVESLRK